MNSLLKFPIQFFFMFLICSLTSCDKSDMQYNNDESKNTIVLVKYKALPDKASITVSELSKLIEQVKLEPHFIKIKIHVDPEDNTNILLYEEWGEKDYYNSDHMNTAHLKKFIANSRNFLAGPPEISLWNVESIFE